MPDGAAYVQLHVPIDVAEAIASNKHRPSSVVQVSEDTIERMASLIEVPDGDTYPWERTSITANLATTGFVSDDTVSPKGSELTCICAWRAGVRTIRVLSYV
eukprot:1191919-Prorocentrum_minimum.AAC.3